jgi:type IV secretion system protein TrbJ
MILLLSSLWWSSPSEAILGVGDLVYDPAIHFEAITTALMTTQTVVNQVIDLTPLDSSEVGDLGETMETITNKLYIGKGLIPFNMRAVQQTFDLLYPTGDRLPCTSMALELWKDEWATQRRFAIVQSMEAQGMLGMIGYNWQRAVRIASAILSRIGNLQALQAIQQQQAIFQEEQMRLNVVVGVFQRAIDHEKAGEITLQAANRCINQRLLVRPW